MKLINKLKETHFIYIDLNDSIGKVIGSINCSCTARIEFLICQTYYRYDQSCVRTMWHLNEIFIYHVYGNYLKHVQELA